MGSKKEFDRVMLESVTHFPKTNEIDQAILCNSLLVDSRELDNDHSVIWHRIRLIANGWTEEMIRETTTKWLFTPSAWIGVVTIRPSFH